MVGPYPAADGKWLSSSECCGLCEAVPDTEEVVLVVWEPQETAWALFASAGGWLSVYLHSLMSWEHARAEAVHFPHCAPSANQLSPVCVSLCVVCVSKHVCMCMIEQAHLHVGTLRVFFKTALTLSPESSGSWERCFSSDWSIQGCMSCARA